MLASHTGNILITVDQFKLPCGNQVPWYHENHGNQRQSPLDFRDISVAR